jgi:hypothetical protein
MGDVSILDLFWLILKLLAALGLVCLLLLAVYLLCRLAFRMLQSLPRFVTGKASTAVTVVWVLVIVGLITLASFVFQDTGLWKKPVEQQQTTH